MAEKAPFKRSSSTKPLRLPGKTDGNLALKTVAEAFLELFKLLEEYGPSWYAEEHHNRALAAMRVLRTHDIKREAFRQVNACCVPKSLS